MKGRRCLATIDEISKTLKALFAKKSNPKSFRQTIEQWPTYRFGDGWQVRFDYAFFPIDDKLLNLPSYESAYADVMTLQIMKRFGKSSE